MTEHPTQDDLRSGYERSDVNIPRVMTIVAVIAVFLVVVFFLLNSYFLASRENIRYEQVLQPGSEELQQLRERENEILHSYGVVDSANDQYRIPIERAMKLLAEEEFQQRIEESGRQGTVE